MSARDVTERVARIGWFHNFEIIPGVFARSAHPIVESERLPRFGIPENLAGKRVLDVGCCDGYFSFLAESRGADVVAVDSWPHEGFFLARELRSSRVAFVEMSAYDISVERLGVFDLVFFFGVYYHLRNPLRALEAIASVVTERVLVESHVIDDPLPPDAAYARFYEESQLGGDATNWWSPNVRTLVETVRAAGFPRAELVSRYEPSRAVVHGLKGPRTAARARREELLLFVDAPRLESGAWVIEGAAVGLLGRPIGRVLLFAERLDGPDGHVAEAEYGLARPEIAKSYGERFASTGFRFRVEARRLPRPPAVVQVFAESPGGWNSRGVRLPTGKDE